MHYWGNGVLSKRQLLLTRRGIGRRGGVARRLSYITGRNQLESIAHKLRWCKVAPSVLFFSISRLSTLFDGEAGYWRM